MAIRSQFKWIPSVLISFLILLMASILLSAIPSPVAAQVQARLRVIEASNVGSTIDPSLKDLHGQLGSLFRYTSYRLLRDERLNLVANQPTTIPMHEGRVIELTQVGLQPSMAELRVKIRKDGTDLLNTQVRLSPGRTVLIGGPTLGQGVAILALSAQF